MTSGIVSRDVEVWLNAGSLHSQASGFRCCPLGVQFFSSRELEPYKLLRFRLDDPAIGDDPAIECDGVVVNCVPVEDKPGFNVHVYFVDLNAEHQARLSNMAKASGFVCPYCENF